MPHKVALKAKAKLWVQPQVEGGAGVAGVTVASPSTVTQMSKLKSIWGRGRGLKRGRVFSDSGGQCPAATIFMFSAREVGGGGVRKVGCAGCAQTMA